MNLEMTANNHVAQLRLEHARLENRTREMEEMASQNAFAWPTGRCPPPIGG